ncbi:MAG: cobalt ECF transporter T component CbiQ [Clostridium sp.]|nr:cobalt ECF transporter T component CbiQ [Clostridium sp.]
MRGSRHVFSMDYYAFRSGLLYAAPGFKLFFAVLAMALCLWGDNNGVSCFVILSVAALNIRKNRVGLKAYLHLLAIPVAFIFLGCCALALDAGYGPHGWFIRITRESAGTGIRVMLRTFGAVSALYFLTLSTPAGEVVRLLGKLHVPGIVTELMYLIYRYIFIMMDTQGRIRTAAESRLGYRDFITSCKTFGASLGNLLVITLKRSGAYYDAMESRGYDGELLFMEEERQFKIRWLLWAGLYGAAGAGLKLIMERGGWV